MLPGLWPSAPGERFGRRAALGEKFGCGARGGHTLHLAWQAHADTVERALAFSPDERLLATGSWDGTIKLWDVESGALLWTGWQTDVVENLAFAPDGQRLASCGDDGAIQVWELESGERVRTLRRDWPYERLDISGVKGLTEAQRGSLRALGAVEEATTSA